VNIIVRYQITCTVLSADQSRIEKVGLVEDGSATNIYNYLLTTEEVNNIINQGHKCFFVDRFGASVEVSGFDNSFIRSDPDGIKYNNLRALPHCRV
jgi:hypothetical protein